MFIEIKIEGKIGTGEVAEKLSTLIGYKNFMFIRVIGNSHYFIAEHRFNTNSIDQNKKVISF